MMNGKEVGGISENGFILNCIVGDFDQKGGKADACVTIPL